MLQVSIKFWAKHKLGTFEVHYFVQFSQYFWNFAKRLKRPDTKRFFGKVSLIFAQFKKLVNFKKFLICVSFRKSTTCQLLFMFLNWQPNLEMFTKLHFFQYKSSFQGWKLEISLTFLIGLIFTVQQRLLIVLIDVTERMIWISLWISCGFFHTPATILKLVSWPNIMCLKIFMPYSNSFPLVPGINNDQSLIKFYLRHQAPLWFCFMCQKSTACFSSITLSSLLTDLGASIVCFT